MQLTACIFHDVRDFPARTIGISIDEKKWLIAIGDFDLHNFEKFCVNLHKREPHMFASKTMNGSSLLIEVVPNITDTETEDPIISFCEGTARHVIDVYEHGRRFLYGLCQRLRDYAIEPQNHKYTVDTSTPLRKPILNANKLLNKEVDENPDSSIVLREDDMDPETVKKFKEMAYTAIHSTSHDPVAMFTPEGTLILFNKTYGQTYKQEHVMDEQDTVTEIKDYIYPVLSALVPLPSFDPDKPSSSTIVDSFSIKGFGTDESNGIANIEKNTRELMYRSSTKLMPSHCIGWRAIYFEPSKSTSYFPKGLLALEGVCGRVISKATQQPPKPNVLGEDLGAEEIILDGQELDMNILTNCFRTVISTIQEIALNPTPPTNLKALVDEANAKKEQSMELK